MKSWRRSKAAPTPDGIGFTAAVVELERAVAAQDISAAPAAFDRVAAEFAAARVDALTDGAIRLAAMLPEIPATAQANAGLVIGACVERGVDAAAVAPGVLPVIREALEAATRFCRHWTEGERGELPDPESTELTEALLSEFGVREAFAWWHLVRWESVAVAMLSSGEVRTNLRNRPALIAAADELRQASGYGMFCLWNALMLLDDERLVALDRETGKGFVLRMSGLADNFQLHTLLAAQLVGTYLPGVPPTRREVDVCRDIPGEVPTRGHFNLVAADGSWVWNEGTPSDISHVDGVRLVVLDPPPYARTWQAGRFFPGVPGDLILERVMDPAEAARWFAHVAPAHGLGADA